MGWIGGLLLIAAGTGLGLYAAHRLHRRVLFLDNCDRLLQRLLQEMSYTSLPLSELWQRLARSEALGDFSLLRDTAAGMTTAPFSAAFAAAVARAEQEGWILPTVRTQLLAFGEGCGRTDLVGQQQHIAYHRTLLQREQEGARQQWQEQGRVYRVLGAAGGTALALLLL